MKLSHFKKQANREFTLADLADLAEFVETKYDPQQRDSHAICALLGSKYSNLTPIKIDTMIYGGNVQIGGHTVLLVDDTKLLIDPTGDYIESSDPNKLRFTLAPWIYSLNLGGNFYLSQNRLPCFNIDVDLPKVTDSEIGWSMLQLTGKVPERNLRVITL